MNHRFLIRLCVLGAACAAGNVAGAATEAQVQAAIQKGQGYLSSKLADLRDGPRSFAAYALLKTGFNKDDARIQGAIAEAVKAADEHYSPGLPRYGHEFAYTVPCHIFLLEAADPVAYLPQLEAMAGYLVEHQQENGSWFYTTVPTSEACDTSQAQFALLGLWAAHRAGADVPSTAWQKAGHWFLNVQREDGGYIYQPFAGSDQKNQQATLSITLAGASALLLVRHVFYPDSKFGDDVASQNPKSKKHGVLERMRDQQAKQRDAGKIDIPVAALDKGINRAIRAIEQRFQDKSHFQTYLYYAMERVGALLDEATIGKHNWYDAASDGLVLLQTADGSWSDTAPAAPATSFAILCLNRTTAAIIGNPPPTAKKLGGGLLAGARGLPSDLSKLKLKDGQPAERKSKGAVDDLLADLEKVQDVSVDEVQDAILESVNLDDPDQLVGQVERLKRLAVDKRTEVRRTALWAIGRSGEVRLAPLLIAGLSDADVDVIREASFGLTVLSRKPTGIIDERDKQVPVDPLDGLEEDATEEKRQSHLDTWFAQAIPAWKKWYLSVRPYEERDDRLSIQRKK